jgi:hypothetical protein
MLSMLDPRARPAWDRDRVRQTAAVLADPVANAAAFDDVLVDVAGRAS